MARGEWARAVRTWRHILNDESRPDWWVQYGHALKELGYFADAERAYAKGKIDSDVDGLIQKAHFEKTLGHFESAAGFYDQAAKDAPLRAVEIDGYKEPLLQIRAARKVAQATSWLLISHAGPRLGEADARVGELLGKANYSYSFAARGFVRAAADLGLDFDVVARPEFVPRASVLTSSEAPVHISFNPPSNARLLKGSYNVLSFAWEFPSMMRSGERPSPHAFGDPRVMLDLFDEIWVPASFTVDIVRKYTDKPVFHAPSPITLYDPPAKVGGRRQAIKTLQRARWQPLSIFPIYQARFDQISAERARPTGDIKLPGRERPAPIYLSVCNPHDRRKQLTPLLRGFARFLAHVPDAILLLKTTSPTPAPINWEILHRQLDAPDLITAPLVSDRILICNDVLSEHELAALYRLSTFYVCTSHAEGQNLPLLEAMGAGCVPVSVRNTAMLDYLSDDNSLDIASHLEDAPAYLVETHRIDGFKADIVTEGNVETALLRSARMSASEYARISSGARETIAKQFMTTRLEKLFADVRERARQRAAS